MQDIGERKPLPNLRKSNVTYIFERKIGLLLVSPSTDENSASPDDEVGEIALLATRFGERLAARNLSKDSPDVVVRAATSAPSEIGRALDEMIELRCDRIVVAPLHSHAPSGVLQSLYAQIFQAFAKARRLPALQVLAPFHREHAYISALSSSIRRFFDRCERVPDAFVLTFPGLSGLSLGMGDPYFEACHRTAHLLRVELGLLAPDVLVAFARRDGGLMPQSSQVALQLAVKGARMIALVSPTLSFTNRTFANDGAADLAYRFESIGSRTALHVPILSDVDERLDLLDELLRADFP